MKSGIYPSKSGVNSISFIDIGGGLSRLLVNCDPFKRKRAIKRSGGFDIQRIEITFDNSERSAIEKAVSAVLDGSSWPTSWPTLVYFGEDRDYAWTKLAMERGRHLLPRKIIGVVG